MARACHQLVGAAACIDDRTRVAVVSMQALVATGGCVPDNCVVRSVSRRDPGRAATVLILTPGKHDGGRICRGNFISHDRTGIIVESKIRSQARMVSDRGYSSVSA